MKRNLYIVERVLMLILILWFAGHEGSILDVNQILLLAFSALSIVGSLAQSVAWGGSANRGHLG